MPWDMIMSIPIHERREFIRRHNDEQSREYSAMTAKEGEKTVGKSEINTYAEMTQIGRSGGKRS